MTRIVSILMISGVLLTTELKGQHFKGNFEAIVAAEEMFEALGGRENWAGLKSLYIKAIHYESSLSQPYLSEIWRGLDTYQLRIEQQNDSFHKLGLFDSESAQVDDVLNKSTRKLSVEDQEGSRKGNDFNIYVLFNRMAANSGYEVRLNGQRIEFYLEDSFVVAFILDSENKPYIFITKKEDGTESVSHFDRWSQTNGLTHPAGGGPVSGGFYFKTLVWQPSTVSFDQAYDFASK